MSFKHPFFAAAACALPLSLAACGGSSSDNSPIVPEGAHYGYVVSSATVVPGPQAMEIGLDLGSKTSSKLDNQPDNKLGMLLSTLSLQVDIQGAITKAIDTGNIILLVDFQTKDLANSSAAGFGVEVGTMPTPAACTDASDTICRHHLDGHGMFQIAPGTPTDAVVAGKIVSTAFTGGPGNATLELALGTMTITMNLQRARVEAAISATGIMNAKIGGLLTQSDIATSIAPAIQVQVANLLTQSCTGSPPTCGCTGNAAPLLIELFDTNKDCKVSTDEIVNSQFFQTELQPDVCIEDSCANPDGVSVGVEVQAVKAMFPGVTM